MSNAYKRQIYFRKVGQMVELPSNVIQADEFAQVLKEHEQATIQWFNQNFGVSIYRKSFFSFGTNDLTQTTMGADRDQDELKHIFNEGHRFVIESMRHVVNIARGKGIECGSCGQWFVNLAKTNPEAAEEILLMLDYVGTDYLGTELAIIRSASATLRHGKVQKVTNGTLTLVDKFNCKLQTGAAARPLYQIKTADDLRKTYIGDGRHQHQDKNGQPKRERHDNKHRRHDRRIIGLARHQETEDRAGTGGEAEAPDEGRHARRFVVPIHPAFHHHPQIDGDNDKKSGIQKDVPGEDRLEIIVGHRHDEPIRPA